MKLDEAALDFKPARVGFVADVSSAVRALMRQPMVALVPIVLWTFQTFPYVKTSQGRQHQSLWLFITSIAMIFFMCGWAGAERIFFLRQFRGKPITLRQLFGLVKPFMGRFIVLGLFVGLALIPWSIFLTIAFGGTPKVGTIKYQVCTMSFAVAVDFALTFVPAALAFTTRSVLAALRIGFAMIRQTWPRCGLYVLFPPLALSMNSLINQTEPVMARWMIAVCLAVVALLAKGATVAFYLRARPVDSEDGAAHIRSIDEAIIT
jgi:hypothetical protein